MIKTMLKQNNTLQINVAQLLKSPIGTTRDYTVQEEVDIAGTNRTVHGEVELTRSDRSILVHGVLHVDVDLNCSRCLSEFSAPLTLDIQEEYLPKINVYSGEPLPKPEEDREAFSIDERNILDLLEAVRQYALLAVPMKPLCKPDCARPAATTGTGVNALARRKTSTRAGTSCANYFLIANKASINEQEGRNKMPPQPKRKYAKSRQGERRQHLKIVATALENCPQCQSKKQPHHVCPTCGYYAGREVIEIKGPETKKPGK